MERHLFAPPTQNPFLVETTLYSSSFSVKNNVCTRVSFWISNILFLLVRTIRIGFFELFCHEKS